MDPSTVILSLAKDYGAHLVYLSMALWLYRDNQKLNTKFIALLEMYYGVMKDHAVVLEDLKNELERTREEDVRCAAEGPGPPARSADQAPS